jgi:hypothetical protein
MAKCRNCYAPIFFLTEYPEMFNAGTWNEPRAAFREIRPIPIDVDPDPAGFLAIYEYPNNFVYTGGRSDRYVRKLEGPTRDLFVRLGGVVYRSHFATCPAKRN